MEKEREEVGVSQFFFRMGQYRGKMQVIFSVVDLLLEEIDFNKVYNVRFQLLYLEIMLILFLKRKKELSENIGYMLEFSILVFLYVFFLFFYGKFCIFLGLEFLGIIVGFGICKME